MHDQLTTQYFLIQQSPNNSGSIAQLRFIFSSWSLFCAQPGQLCVQALGKDIKLQSTTVLTIFARFLYVFGASLVVGLTFGLGTAVLLKVLKSNSAPQVIISA